MAAALAAGKVVGWFQGRSEFGPRALGNRSILADPRNPGMRDRINNDIKKREWFRPFAPIVLAERASEWFDFDRESPFMLFTARVLDPDLVPAISHIDGSARLQTVTPSSNGPVYDLIQRFYGLTGVPMLLKTLLDAGFLHGGLKRAQVDLSQRAFIHFNVDGVALPFLIVGDKVLGA